MVVVGISIRWYPYTCTLEWAGVEWTIIHPTIIFCIEYRYCLEGTRIAIWPCLAWHDRAINMDDDDMTIERLIEADD